MVFVLKRHWVPDFLEGVVSLAAALGLFAISNAFQHESGLLTVTVMGLAMANQKKVSVKHILEFKEHLRVLLISCLFIVLAARLTDAKLAAALSWQSMAFLAALVLVVRPACVFISTARSGLSVQEKLFVCWMAPRGIVAAAVAS